MQGHPSGIRNYVQHQIKSYNLPPMGNSEKLKQLGISKAVFCTVTLMGETGSPSMGPIDRLSIILYLI